MPYMSLWSTMPDDELTTLADQGQLRTNLAEQLSDGSTALSYRHADVASIDPLAGDTDLPGWAAAYTKEELRKLFDAYKSVDESALWDNLAYFLERVIPTAESAGVKMGIHPDDPPWSIFGPSSITTGRTGISVTSG